VEQPKIKSDVQKLIVDYLKLKGVSQRKFAELTGVSDTTYGTYRRMSSAMGVDILDKILSAYPDLKGELIKYLTGNKNRNITHMQKNGKDAEINLGDARETFYRDLIENNQEYSLLPKAVLRDYKIVPDKLLDIITTAKDEVNSELKKKQEYIIELYEGKIKQLEKEKEDLRRQIPPK
jgi:transcriptional regulator with XRE-family HTH domain